MTNKNYNACIKCKNLSIIIIGHIKRVIYMLDYMNEKELKQFIVILSNEFKRIRHDKELTLEDVGFDLDLSPSYIGKIENGRLSKMSIFMYIKLAEYYDVKLSEIISLAEEKYEANKKFFD